jgi:hypothetical protein
MEQQRRSRMARWFEILPAWIRDLWVHVFAGGALDPVGKGPENKIDSFGDQLDEFGRVLFAAPGYGTC